MNNWIMPCNINYFDIIKRFEESDYVVWRRGAKIEEGDEIYIYVGVPFSKILYKCVVEDSDVNSTVVDQNSYARIGGFEKNKRYMQLKLVHVYKEGISLEKLKQIGLFGVRRQTQLDTKVVDYIKTQE